MPGDLGATLLYGGVSPASRPPPAGSGDRARCMQAAGPQPLRDPGRGKHGHLRFHRRLVQPASSALVHRLLVTRQLREEDICPTLNPQPRNARLESQAVNRPRNGRNSRSGPYGRLYPSAIAGIHTCTRRPPKLGDRSNSRWPPYSFTISPAIARPRP